MALSTREPLVQMYPRMKTFLVDVNEVGSIFTFSSRFVEKKTVQIMDMGEKMIENIDGTKMRRWVQNVEKTGFCSVVCRAGLFWGCSF